MSARILVADDSVTIQKVVELTFSKEDFTLTQARSGEETIRKAREARPDLVLLDLVMPDMNGYDVCAALRAEPSLRNVPIILLAGTFETLDRQRGLQAGANDFVTKPFESQLLIGKVKQFLFAKAMEAGGTGHATRPSADAVTVRIPTAPDASAPLAPARPAAPPQEALWQLLGSSPTPVAASSQLVTPGHEQPGPGTPGEADHQPLDMSSITLEPLPPGGESAAAAMDVLPLPESLSLDDLLASGDEAPAGEAVRGPGTEEPLSMEPVFELSDTETPLLPMVEAGNEGRSALSVEDLLSAAPPETAPEDTLTLELPELDLAAAGESDRTAAVMDAPLPTSPEAAAPLSGVAAPEVAGFDFTAQPAGTADVAFLEPAPTPEAVEAPEAPRVAAVEFGPSDMAAMKEAVTERVAEDLKRELSEKLVERFEKIVWEVVPDLAEILITKEIERIRRLAEEERPS